MTEKEQITVRIPVHLAKWCRDAGLRPQRLLEMAIQRAMGEMDPELRIREILELEQRLVAEKGRLQAQVLRRKALERERVAIQAAVQAALEKNVDVLDWPTIAATLQQKATEGYDVIASRPDAELKALIKAEWHTARKSALVQNVLPGSMN